MSKNSTFDQGDTDKIVGELLVILALPSALPVATGGIAHALSIPIVLLAFYSLILDSAHASHENSRAHKAREKVLSIQKVRQFHDSMWLKAGQLFRARAAFLFKNRLFRAVTALCIILCAICFWTIIPVADTPPSVAVMLFGFSLVYRDILVWLAALLLGTLAVTINFGVLIVTVTAAVSWLRSLLG